MTLIEALKTGRRIRRHGNPFADCSMPNKFLTLSVSEILADDWEVEPEEKNCFCGKYKIPGACPGGETHTCDWCDVPTKKPRLFAWCEFPSGGRIHLTDRESGFYSAGWVRAPWLDEPEDKV